MADLWSCCTNKILQDLYISDSCYYLHMTFKISEGWHQVGSRDTGHEEQRANTISRSFCESGEVCFTTGAGMAVPG